MTLTGVICEYNPFHRGHLAQLKAAGYGEDGGVVCVMGGNFLQRGEPAVVSKHARAKMAVKCGADLVVELPAPWAVSSAESFARGGAALLGALGADRIAFGAECPDVERLTRLARGLLSGEAAELTKKRLEQGLSYAAAREGAAAELLGEDARLLREPNNILAVEYIKALESLGLPMTAVGIPRTGVGHHGEHSGGYASGSFIRSELAAGRDVSGYIPEAAYEVIREELAAGRGPVTMDRAETAALWRLRTMSDEEFMELPDSGEGLWRRFAGMARTGATLEEVLMGTKTKRYALSRLRRMAVCAMLSITRRDQQGLPPYIRVLAIGERGREILKRAKGLGELPIITKPASGTELSGEAGRIFNIDVRASRLYALLYPDPAQRRGGEELRTTPFVLSPDRA